MDPYKIDSSRFYGTRTEYTNLDGTRYERIIDPYGNMEIRPIPGPTTLDTTLPGYAVRDISGNLSCYSFGKGSYDPFKEYEMWKKMKESKGKHKMNIRSERLDSKTYRVYCDNRIDLAVENILKTLASMKGKLMLDIAPLYAESIECSVTPEIKNRLLMAGRKLKMYGKKPPLVVRFDEWGDRLPDEIRTEDGSGIQLNIVDPQRYGELYFELRATKKMYNYNYTISDYHDYDGSVPF